MKVILKSHFITLIPKSGKNTTKYHQSCRSISLMNTDEKIINEIFAKRIQPHIRKIIYRAEVSFIVEMQGCNTHQAINIMQHIKRIKD
jgi:hypothetical protein